MKLPKLIIGFFLLFSLIVGIVIAPVPPNPIPLPDDAFNRITILSPKDGETVNNEDYFSFQWESSGNIPQVSIYYNLLTENDPSFTSSWVNIANCIDNDGTFNWYVPSIESDNVRIKIVGRNCIEQFTIAESTRVVRIIEEGNPMFGAYYPFNGDAKDNYGNYNGIVNGATFVSGFKDQALSFDGLDDYVDLGSNEIIGSRRAFTISMWIKANAFSDFHSPLYGEYYSGSDGAKNYLGVFSDGDLFFDQFRPMGNYIRADSKLQTGIWYQILYTQDGTSRSIYVNGEQIAFIPNMETETYTDPRPDQVRVGMHGGTIDNQRFNGIIDELRIFNYALSVAEIEALFSQTPPPEVVCGPDYDGDGFGDDVGKGCDNCPPSSDPAYLLNCVESGKIKVV